MKKLPICLAILLAALAGCSPKPSQAASLALPGVSGPQAWVDAPLEGMHLPMAPYEIVFHITDDGGVQAGELSINGSLVSSQPNPHPGEKLAVLTYLWSPDTPGQYERSVRAQGAGGAWGPFASVTVQVGELTATPTQTPTATPSPSMTLTPSASPTSADTPTPTPTSTPAGLQFQSSASANQIFTGGCSLRAVDISVSVSPSPYSVVLFVKLVDTASGTQTAWTSYAAMTPKGDGRFVTRVDASAIPEATRFASAWMAYQFVATSAGGEILGRSATLQDVVVSACGGSPFGATTATVVITPPAVLFTVRPPIFPVPTRTPIVIK